MNKEESIAFATKYLEDILSFFGVNLAVKSSYDDDVIQLAVPSSSLNACLIGRDAETLRSLQHLVSMALFNKSADLVRVNLDVADYKKQRELKVAGRAEGWIKQVRETGKSMVLDLSPADRRVVHKMAEDYSDVKTYSEGEGRERKLIIEKVES
jgi:spoIIIJ-associated protein